MIDVAILRENPEVVRKSIRARFGDASLVDTFIKTDEAWRAAAKELDDLRHTQKAEGRKGDISSATKTKELIKNAEADIHKLAAEREQILLRIPNIILDDVPVAKDEKGNQTIRTWGTPPEFDFEPKDHMELGTALGLIDTERAAKISGARFAYLFREAALLEFALIHHAFTVLTSPQILMEIADRVEKGYSAKSFIPVMPPMMMRPEVMQKMARLSPEDADERYHFAKDDVYLVGSAEHTLGPLHMGETLDEPVFPIRYAGFSTSFRREAGTYGKDTRGILRLHQFDKLELESFTLPEDSRKEQDFFVAIQEYLLQSLNLPYRVVVIASGDMGKPDARQIDIETWMPGQAAAKGKGRGNYRETHTSDLMTDYQARRLGTKVRRKNGETEFVHTNDATGFAIGRTLIAIIENYQTADGSVSVPPALQPYLNFKKITRK